MGSSGHCTRINRRLLPVKLHYFLFMAALACALPFRTIFAKQLGISATAVGVIFCIIPFLKTITNPLFGFVLDYFKKFRLTLSVIITFVALSHIAMVFIPPRASISPNMTNITDFHLKIRYFCASDDCDPSLMVYSEYSVTNKSERERSGFTCDMLCSGLTNVAESQRREDRLQCHDQISLDIKVRVDTSHCDMNFSLESGKIFITSKDAQNPITETINESSVIRFKSWRMPAGNCSETAINHSNSFPEKNDEQKFSQGGMLEDEYVSTKRYASTAMPDLMNSENAERLYAEYTYSIKMLNGNSSFNSSCTLDFICEAKKCYSDVRPGNFGSGKSVDSENEFLSAQFWGFFFLMTISSVMLSAVIFLMDAVCYELLQENKEDYGKQRLWGTVGWGIGALVGGYLNQIVTAESSEVDYAPSFGLLTLFVFIDLIPIYNLKVTELKYSSHIWKDVCFLFTKMDIIYNAIIVFSVGALSGFIWNYQFWFMEEIGSSQVLLGLSQTLECVFELPWFVVSGWIIEKIGNDHCNNITFLCFGLRYLCFAVMYNPWWTLAAGFFHGPTFGLFYASMTMYAKNRAPPGTEATVQSLLHFFFEGIGIATGSFLGGVGLDKFGSRMSFLYAASISFLLLFINLLMGILFSRTYRNSKQSSVTSSRP